MANYYDRRQQVLREIEQELMPKKAELNAGDSVEVGVLSSETDDWEVPDFDKVLEEATDVSLTSRARRGELSYTFTKRQQPEGIRTYLSVTCAKCKEETTHEWSTGNHVDYVKKRFLLMGWEFDPYSKSSCVCPNCNKKAPKMNTNPTPTVIEMPAPPRALTADERHRVRTLLDTNFDDAKGHYIDGYSDKRIGEETAVPWASVAQLREIAYGPLKDDPTVAVRGDVAKLKTTLGEASAKLADLDQSWRLMKREVDQLVLSLKAVEDKLRNL